MSVQDGPTSKRYATNGVTTIFAIPFLLLDAADLQVTFNGAAVTSGFTITGVGNPTSTITFTTAPVALGDLLLELSIPFQRLIDYQENGDFLAKTVNRDFDRIWQALKQLLRYNSRSLTLGTGDIDGQGSYRAKGNRISNLGDPIDPQDAATKHSVAEAVSGEAVVRAAADANLQAQLTGNIPLEASAFSEISWHGQTINNSVNIPANKNAWSFGPQMTIGDGQFVTVGEDSLWTIANGATSEEGTLLFELPAPLDFGAL